MMSGVENSPSTSPPPTTLPMLDIGPLLACHDGVLDYDDAAVQGVGQAMRAVCTQHGFFYISSRKATLPLLPPEILESMIHTAAAFFALPLEEKDRYNARNSPLWRGYQSEETGQHSCDPSASKREGKESFTIGMEKGPPCPMVGPNQWPSSEFSVAVGTYVEALLRISHSLMIGLAAALGLPQHFFVSRASEPVAQLVLLRYPPKSDDTVGCGSHTDCGFLTILWQSDEGLQVKDKATDTWMEAPPLPGTFVVNLGDMVQHWTGGLFKSTWHRVRSSASRTRYSMPFFCNTNFHTLIETIPGCAPVGVGAGVAKSPVTAGDYLVEKLGLMYK